MCHILISDISESNVKVRLNRAKRMLRQEIERTYSAEDIYEFNLRSSDRIVERVMTEITRGSVIGGGTQVASSPADEKLVTTPSALIRVHPHLNLA